MPTDKASLSERVAKQFAALSSAARDLNTISDDLGISVSELDAALKKLNLGFDVWVPISEDSGLPDESWYWREDVGYAKNAGNWGICLRKISGDYQADDSDEDVDQQWPFNDAPRAFRLAAIDKIPDLLEKLASEAVETTKKVREKLNDVQTVTEAVKTAAAAHLASLDLDRLRRDATKALANQGHSAASQLLTKGKWSLNSDGRVRIEVPNIGQKVLELTVNAAAQKIIAREFREHGIGEFLIMPQPLGLNELLPKAQKREGK